MPPKQTTSSRNHPKDHPGDRNDPITVGAPPDSCKKPSPSKATATRTDKAIKTADSTARRSLPRVQAKTTSKVTVSNPPKVENTSGPTIDEICAAPWTTLRHVPIREEWTQLLVDCLRRLVSAPSITFLTELFFISKGLLASVRRGGKARMEAVARTLRSRLLLWKTGQFNELWQRLNDDHRKRTSNEQRQEDKENEREAKRVANLVDQGLLSRAASQLCSRGLAPFTPATFAKVVQLFPPGPLPLKVDVPTAPSFEIQPKAMGKLIMKCPKGLAPGCSGLRAEHLKAVLCDRNLGRAGECLSGLTKFANLCVGGYLPPELQPYLCGGRLIPLNNNNKKKS